jgi:nucleotide-binding universal stress UspA family protein
MTSPTIGIRPEQNDMPLDLRNQQTGQLPELRHILLCTDFSLASKTATEVAIDLCKRTSATMCVLHICEYGLYSAPTEGDAAYVSEGLQREEQYLKNVVDRIRREGILADGVTETGHPPVSIVEYIASHSPDLAIVGTNGLGGLERMIFGSTAEAVFRRASCPVMIIGPRVSFDKQNGHGPVIFATDFHEPATQAMRYASALAQTKALPLHCLHVLPYSKENEAKDGVLHSIMTEAMRQVARTAQIGQSEPEISYNIMFDSEISHAVVDYAKEHQASYIVLGVRRGPVLSSHLPPHLTYRMIATSPCPVLTISPEAARLAASKSNAMAKTEH